MFVYYGGVGLQTIRIWRRIGRCPIPGLISGGAADKLVAAGGFAWPLPVLAWAYCPSCFQDVPRLAALEHWPVRLLGLLCLCLATSVIWMSYAELGDSWRAGIDPEPGPLVERGIYASVRHPVYAALILGFFGIFLLAPNRMFAILWIVGSCAAVAEAFREERFLRSKSEAAYRDYCARTGRFFPPLAGPSGGNRAKGRAP